MNNKLFREIELFHSLSDKELDQIVSKMIVKQFKKNETILYEDDMNEFMYVVLSGKVKVVRTTEEGKEIILAMNKAGSFFGEMSLIDGKTTSASVIATEAAQIAMLAKEDFFSVFSLQNKAAHNLMKMLCARLRSCNDNIEMLNFNNSLNRTKTLMLMLIKEYGENTPEGTVLNIKLTHQDISEMTGLTRESVTRVMDKLQKQKEIIVLKKRFICLTPRFMQEDINSPVVSSKS